jgi:hypothetical protein
LHHLGILYVVRITIEVLMFDVQVDANLVRGEQRTKVGEG